MATGYSSSLAALIPFEFEPDARTGFAFFGMQEELSKMLNRKVDLNTPQFLSPYFRDEVLAEAEAQYAAS